jgi:hypothetical protein
MKNLCTNVLNNNRLNKSNDIIVRTYLKNNLSAHGGVAKLEFLNLTSNTDISNVLFKI